MKIAPRLERLLRRVLGREPLRDQRWKAMQATIVASPEDKAIAERVRFHTMTGPFRIHALLDAVEHVTQAQLPGAFVECGVWRGGSVMAMLLKLLQLGINDRDVYLYDTFEGMTAPTADDTSAFEAPAADTWGEAQARGERGWHHLFKPEMFTEQSVRESLATTGYPLERLHFVRGPVEQTIPGTLPGEIALLRLDTDWYESTRHELQWLYPKLVPGGVLIIDDYGHWRGCRKAVDEYFAQGHAPRPLLSRIDYSARIAVKR